MNRRNILYWICQAGGWGLFVLGNFVIASMQEQPFGRIAVLSALIFLMGIGTTHVFRNFIKKRKWARLNILSLLPRIAFSSIIMSLIFTGANTAFTDIMNHEEVLIQSAKTTSFLLNVLNFSALFLLWNIIYFAVKSFENWKREEISNLELQAAKTEIELNSFKAQMNPHFMFNSLNSIRALVDEDPERAKQAITMMSGILRNTLILGKKQTVLLAEELDLVEKYLSLEKIRFEERLDVIYVIEPGTLNSEIPPFILQTIAENGIKHGISKRIEGGFLKIESSLRDNVLEVIVINSGQFPEYSEREGIGLSNTKKRIELLYGEEAEFSIHSQDDVVVAKLIIPQKNTGK